MEPVALVKVTACRVLDARERTPPVAVVRPVTPRVLPKVAAPEMLAVPETARVPVAIRLVVRRLVAIVVEETVSDPESHVLPVTSRIEEVVEVALLPRTRMSAVSVG